MAHCSWLKAHGSRLMAHGSGIMAHGSWLMADGQRGGPTVELRRAHDRLINRLHNFIIYHDYFEKINPQNSRNEKMKDGIESQRSA